MSVSLNNFKNLEVWEKAHKFVLGIYLVTVKFPKDEINGVTSQIRKASVSIPTNIAKGSSGESEKDFARFLQISISSASESEHLLTLCHDLRYLNKDEFEKLHDEVITIRKMLINQIKS